jgi:CBS domain-containing protein
MHELKNAVLAFVKYGPRGFSYLWMRYAIAPRILSYRRSLEKPAMRADLSMHMLTGARDFLMALWSLASWYRVMPDDAIGELVVHSDGTLTDTHRAVVTRLYPSARVEDAARFMDEHGHELDPYPVVKEFRAVYPKFQSKKLVDPYVISTKPLHLLLDSDMLWFREPTELIEAIRAGAPTALMMSNQGDRIHVTFADGSQTSDEVAQANSGIVLYRREDFSLRAFAAYLQQCEYLGRKFTDQACFATILNPRLLPGDRYLIKGTLTDAIVMRHYTNPQRLKFFFYGLDRVWRKILK